jgi:hypothetical protein
MTTHSELNRLILQHVARRSAEDTDNRDGWCRWSTSDRWPWDWHDYKPLVSRGLLARREDWKDVMLKLTEAGWSALGERCACGYGSEEHEALQGSCPVVRYVPARDFRGPS